MESFKKKSLIDIYFKMSLDEVVDYYQKLREYELTCDEPVKGIEIRKALYRIVRIILLIDEVTSKRRVIIHNDQRDTTYDYLNSTVTSNKDWKNHSKIYSCTHIGRYDIESVLRGINDPCFFVMADAGESYKNIDGLLLRMNGVTWFDMDRSIDRHYANVRQLKVLNGGGNEFVFPEAAYNLEPYEIVGKLHPGVCKRAILTNSYVVPVSLEQYEKDNKKDYVLNIGKTIDLHDTKVEDALEISEYIRNEMIELKKDIWKIYGGSKPTKEEFDNDPDALAKYKERIDFIMRDVPSYYTIADIVREYYEPSDDMVKSLKDLNYLK